MHAMTLSFIFVLLALLACRAVAEELQLPPMAVTDLRIIVADSQQTALHQCHAIDSSYVSVGVDWTMGAAPTARFVQLCKQRQRLQDSYTGDVVQRLRILSSHCPGSASVSSGHQWSTLHTPRAGVVVCMLKTTAQRARQLSEFLVDVDVTRTQFYNDALPSWTTLRDASVHEWRNATEVKAYTGVYVSVRQPPSSIVSLSTATVHATAPEAASASACGGAEDIGRLSTGNANNDSVVLCVARQSTASQGNGSLIVDVTVVGVNNDCNATANGTETTKKSFTTDLVLCVTSANASTHATNSISDLRVERWRPSDGSTDTNVTFETERFVAAVNKSGFERLPTPTLLENSTTEIGSVPFLFLRRALPTPDLLTETNTSLTLTSTPSKPALKARASGGGLVFKILQLADLHYTGDASTLCQNAPSDNCTEATMTAFVSDLLDLERPDFVVLTGDNVQTRSVSYHQAAMDAAMSQLEQRSVPYALIFGNHDGESDFSRDKLIQKAMAQPHSYTQRGPTQVDGVGNYQLTVQAPTKGAWGGTGASVFRIYFLDSHAYLQEDEYPLVESFYDWIKPRQVQFFQQLSRSLTRVSAAVLFFHIPLLEYAAAPVSDTSPTHGGRREPVSAGNVNSHLFSALVDQHEVKATFVGHDHVNDYCYKREGIQLCYGGGAGLGQAYGDSSVPRRARVIEWSVDGSNRHEIRSWKRFHENMKKAQDVETLYSERPASAWLLVLYCGLTVAALLGVGIASERIMRRRKKNLYEPAQRKPTPLGDKPARAFVSESAQDVEDAGKESALALDDSKV